MGVNHIIAPPLDELIQSIITSKIKAELLMKRTVMRLRTKLFQQVVILVYIKLSDYIALIV